MHKIILLSLLSLIIVYSSCEESGEGCLDFFSSNYDFQAVSSCDSCCTYPTSSLNLDIAYSEEDFRFSLDTFFTEAGDTLILHNIELLLSEFEFLGDNGEYTVRDTIVNSAINIKDDFIFIKSGGLKTIGPTRFTDTIRSFNVTLGFNNDNINLLKPFSNLDQSGTLDEALDSLYVNETDTYFAGKFQVQIFDSIREVEIPNDLMNKNLNFDVLVPVQPGVAWSPDLKFDIKLLLNGLNKNMSNEEVSTTLTQNLAGSFYVE